MLHSIHLMLTGDLNTLHNLSWIIKIDFSILTFLLPQFSDNECANPPQEDPSPPIRFLQPPRVSKLAGPLHPSLALVLKSASLNWAMVHVIALTLKQATVMPVRR